MNGHYTHSINFVSKFIKNEGCLLFYKKKLSNFKVNNFFFEYVGLNKKKGISLSKVASTILSNGVNLQFDTQ